MLTSGAKLVSRLPPLKRILCACSAATKNNTTAFGLAVSDPYLARAEVLIPSDAVDLHLVSSGAEFLEGIGFTDVGAVVMALPMMESDTDGATKTVPSSDDVMTQRLSLLEIFQSFAIHSPPFRLIAFEDGRPSWAEIKKLAAREPIMWEDLHFLEEDECHHHQGDASVHAAAALTLFLQKHVGAWHNTFA